MSRAGAWRAKPRTARAYQNFCLQRLLFRVAAGLVAPYKKPWLFPQALRIAEQVIRPVSEAGKIDYAAGVDPGEICNLRYLTVIRERLSAALRPGEGPERFLQRWTNTSPSGPPMGSTSTHPRTGASRPQEATSRTPSWIPVSNTRSAQFQTPLTVTSKSG